MRNKFDEQLLQLNHEMIEMGALVEFGKTETLFSTPKDQRTEDYITGRFG